MKRRSFLKMGAAGTIGVLSGSAGLLLWEPRAHAAVINKTFTITEGLVTQADGVNVYFKSFSSTPGVLTLPGESFVAQEGDTIALKIVNPLATSHSFVIDGVVDSGVIGAGQTVTFQFTVSKAGSYLFYDKQNSPYNRLVGLHGAIAVMPLGITNQAYIGSPTFKKQYFWIFNQIDPVWHERVRNREIPTTEFTPRYFTINGKYSIAPGAPGAMDPARDAMADPKSALHGRVGDRTLVRMFNAGLAKHSVHTHGNHMEWLTKNGAVRSSVWKKDAIPLDGNMGRVDMIYPFETPPDAYPTANTGMYPMHLHDEMSQTSGGGRYLFGSMTEIVFE